MTYRYLNRRVLVRAFGLLAGATLLANPVANAANQLRSVPIQGGRIEYLLQGDGPLVVMIPSLGRGADDFETLAAAVAQAGYRVVRPQPRGIAGSSGPMQGVNVHDLAIDVATVMQDVGGAPAVVLGHAYGQRIARVLTADHPELVRALIMLAAGGKIRTTPELVKAVRACFDRSLSDEEHIEAVKVFFAPGNDPSPWRGGWYGEVANMQWHTLEETAADSSFWWSAGGKVPILVIQGLQDRLAPPGNAHLLKKEFPTRVELVELDRAAHALLPEQPDAIAAAVLTYLGDPRIK